MTERIRVSPALVWPLLCVLATPTNAASAHIQPPLFALQNQASWEGAWSCQRIAVKVHERGCFIHPRGDHTKSLAMLAPPAQVLRRRTVGSEPVSAVRPTPVLGSFDRNRADVLGTPIAALVQQRRTGPTKDYNRRSPLPSVPVPSSSSAGLDFGARRTVPHHISEEHI